MSTMRIVLSMNCEVAGARGVVYVVEAQKKRRSVTFPVAEPLQILNMGYPRVKQRLAIFKKVIWV